MSIVYDLSHLKLPEEFQVLEDYEENKTSWMERILRIAIMLALVLLIVLFMIPKKPFVLSARRRVKQNSANTDLQPEECKIPVLDSDNNQGRILILRASCLMPFDAQVLRILIHLCPCTMTLTQSPRKELSTMKYKT